MVEKLTREELYELVWSQPVVALKERFGISDVAIAKMCRRHDVPVPERGYWAKAQAGKPAPRVKLLERGLGMPAVIEIGEGRKSYYRETPKDLIHAEIPSPPEFTEPLSDLIARVRKLVGKVTVPNGFERAHRHIAKLLDDDRVRQQKKSTWSWDRPLFESPFDRRRLRVLNGLFVALERCGMRPSLRGKDPTEFSAAVGEQSTQFTLDHPGLSRNGYRNDEDFKRQPSAKLRLELNSNWHKIEDLQNVWEDKDEDKIEKFVEDIVVMIIVTGEMRYRRSEVWHHEWLIKRKAELIEEARKQKEEAERRERERRIAAEKARVDRLLSQAAAFRQATDIRQYVRMVWDANAGSEDPAPSDLVEAWAEWALSQADRIDPVRSKNFLIDAEASDEAAKRASDTTSRET